MPSSSRTLTCAKAKFRKTGSEMQMARTRIQAWERSSPSPDGPVQAGGKDQEADDEPKDQGRKGLKNGERHEDQGKRWKVGKGDGGKCRASCWSGIFVEEGTLHLRLRRHIVDQIHVILPCYHPGRIEGAEIIRPVFKQTTFGE